MSGVQRADLTSPKRNTYVKRGSNVTLQSKEIHKLSARQMHFLSNVNALVLNRQLNLTETISQI